jgi:chromate transporter
MGVHELLVLFGAAALYALTTPRRPAEPKNAAPTTAATTATSAQHDDETKTSSALLFGAAPSVAAATAAVAWPSALSVFLVFAKIGSVLFGSGYVLLAFLRSDLVVERHWLTEAQLLDAVAVGQLTPGPVFTTATFVGYLLAGTSGALAATAGIFLPAFFFVAISGPLVPKLRRSPRAGRFLDGLNVASLALMAVVTVSLARAAVVDAWTIALVLGSGALLLRTKINSAWLVLGGAVAGNLARALH